MNKNIIIAVVVGLAIILVGGGIMISKKQSPSQTKEGSTEQPTPENTETEKSSNAPSYPGVKVDEDKCGSDAFYVEEKSADFVKNYCKFLREKGWKLVHQDYPDCEDIKSFGGGYNYEKGSAKISISVIRYGEDATCFWVYEK